MADSKKDSLYEVSLEDLLAAGCHFGHQARRWNPKMAPFIWQTKDKIHIFDLAKTKAKLKEACLAVKELVSEGKTIVLVGTKRQAKEVVRQEAERVNIPYIVDRWLGGTITNWRQIKKSIDKLKELKEKKQTGEFDKYTKKENILIEREISRLEKSFGGIANLTQPAEALFVVDPHKEIAAIKEARMKGIKIFAIVDTNADPDLVDFVIPANDDAFRSIKLIVSVFSQAIKDGLALRTKKEAKKPVKEKKDVS